MSKFQNTCDCAGCIESGTPSVPHTGPHIPLYVLGDLVREWKARNGFDDEIDPKANTNGTRVVLEQLSGVPQRRLHAIEKGWDRHGYTNRPTKASYTKVISFDVADKLVCAMDMVEEWWNGGWRSITAPSQPTRLTGCDWVRPRDVLTTRFRSCET
jgi:hypothetical protein